MVLVAAQAAGDVRFAALQFEHGLQGRQAANSCLYAIYGKIGVDGIQLSNRARAVKGID